MRSGIFRVTPPHILLGSVAESLAQDQTKGQLGMKRGFWIIAFILTVLTGGMVHAQEAWVQIEAQPSLAEAEARARAYAGAFPNVQGYKLSSGWYGILLGPYTPEEAAQQLEVLRAERLIPSDSFVAEADRLRGRFWPAGTDDATADTAATTDTAVVTEQPATAEPATAETAADDESYDEALASESALTADQRMDLQRAMQFMGVYDGKIDGSFGKGTRSAMADWQAMMGYPASGILTTLQRQALIDGWTKEREALGLAHVAEAEAGIEIDLPMGLVEFDRYQPPFVAYKAKAGSGYQAFLISRQGDAKSLAALYDRLQAMQAIPMTGDRALEKSSFTITGEGNGTTAYAQARLEGGFIKGFALIGPTADADRRDRILEAMKTSFTPVGDVALDENLGEPSSTSAADLTSGLEVRRPALSRTGTFVTATGAVLTTTEVLQSCTRITLDGTTEASVTFQDDTLGVALLTPGAPLAPRAFADLATTPPRLDSDVAMAGYSYEDKLDAPVISTGTFSEAKGLNGEAELARLTLTTLPGDVGGAVLDASGAMIGLLAPRKDEAGRALPKDVSFIIQSAALSAALAGSDVTLTPSTRSGALAAEDLAARARDMTVLVSCWK